MKYILSSAIKHLSKQRHCVGQYLHLSHSIGSFIYSSDVNDKAPTVAIVDQKQNHHSATVKVRKSSCSLQEK